MTDEELLEYLYYKKHLYGGIDQLYKKAKEQHPSIKKAFVKNWLDNQMNYQVVKSDKVGKKEFLPIYSEKRYSFQIDLTFFPRYKKDNSDNYVLFTAINVNTRFAYAYYSTDKTIENIMIMLKKMAEKTIINSITCDEGSEFNNYEFNAYCNKNNINIYFVKDDSHKLGIVNRFHRTLKDKLRVYFANDILKWVDVIDQIIYNYNHTVNRGIGYAPVKVTDAIENSIINEKREITIAFKEDNEPDFKIGDKVRVLRKKKTFEDKMMSKYFDSIFVVFGLSANSLYIKNPEGIEYKTKKKYCFIINPDTEIYPSKESKMSIVARENRTNRLLRRESIEEKNILREKRIRKVRVR